MVLDDDGFILSSPCAELFLPNVFVLFYRLCEFHLCLWNESHWVALDLKKTTMLLACYWLKVELDINSTATNKICLALLASNLVRSVRLIVSEGNVSRWIVVSKCIVFYCKCILWNCKWKIGFWLCYGKVLMKKHGLWMVLN